MPIDKKIQILNHPHANMHTNHWSISICLGMNTFSAGFKPHHMFDQLTRLGNIISAKLITAIIPSLENYNPEGCYLGWELILNSRKEKQAIAAVFTNLAEARVSILPPDSLNPTYQDRLEKLSGNDDVLGDILYEIGALTDNELQFALNYQKINGGLIGDILVAQKAVRVEVVNSALEKLVTLKEKKYNTASVVNVDSDKLNQLVSLVGELTIRTVKVDHLISSSQNEVLIESSKEMSLALKDMSAAAFDLQRVPIADIFSTISQAVSAEFNKKIKFEIVGEQTELDRTIVPQILEPLTHIVRNAIEHGFESDAEHSKSGESEDGLVTLKAYHEVGVVVIEVSDNGNGLDPEKILRIAKQRGIVSAEQALYEHEVYDLIFAPGFSSVLSLKNIMSRSSGMDAVRRRIKALNGTVEVNSVIGKGVTITLRVPLSLAIIDGVHLGVAGESFILPLDKMVDCLTLNSKQTAELQVGNFITSNGSALPVIKMNEYLDLRAVNKRETDSTLVVIQSEETKVGILVDVLYAETQVVVKPLSVSEYNTASFSGYSILADGKFALIFDVPGLIKSCVGYQAENISQRLYV